MENAHPSLCEKIPVNALIIGLMAFCSFSCEKILTEPAFDITPKIRLLEVSSDTIIQFQESITLRIEYEDGDGDLGNPDPDINSIFVKDQRLEKADEYYLGPLAPVGAEISIRGVLELQLSGTFLLGNGSREITVFTIYVVDRQGHQSNVIETGEITILKE